MHFAIFWIVLNLSAFLSTATSNNKTATAEIDSVEQLKSIDSKVEQHSDKKENTTNVTPLPQNATDAELETTQPIDNDSDETNGTTIEENFTKVDMETKENADKRENATDVASLPQNTTNAELKVTQDTECKDQYDFCVKLTEAQCKLRIAKQRCPQKCQSCNELPLPPQPFRPGCVDAVSECSNMFYICGTNGLVDKQCHKTCELCPEQNDYAIRKCYAQYGPNFCFKLEVVCSVMVNVTYEMFPPGSVHNLSSRVAECVTSGNVMAMCEAKFEDKFCHRLEEACAQAHNVSLPKSVRGKLYRSPKTIEDCMLSEETLPVCKAFAPEHCSSWKNECGLKNETDDMNEVQENCIRTKIGFAHCKSKYGIEQCHDVENECASAYGSPFTVVDGLRTAIRPVRRCVFKGGVWSACISHHDKTQCKQWKRHCSNAFGIPITIADANSHQKLHEKIANCILSHDVAAKCRARHGDKKCNEIEDGCRRKLEEPKTKLTPTLPYTLSASLIKCISDEM